MNRLRTGWLPALYVCLIVTALTAPGEALAKKAAAGPTYVGSAVCGTCHLGKHETWSQTAHAQILRDGSEETSYINDGDNSGHSDFFDGPKQDIRNLPGGDAFTAFGDNAPKLGKNKKLGPFVKIGSTKYSIAYTLGGSAVQSPTVADADGNGLILDSEAQYKQLYLTKIGASHYLLPIQFNAKTGEYVPYNTSEWYDQNNEPIAKTGVKSAVTAYERRCAGCHSTGVEVKLNNNGFWTMSFADLNVACEACHGPGSDHVAAPTVALKKATIVNPETLVATTDLNGDGSINTVDNLVAQNAVCYQCHRQGTGMYGSGDGALLYPSKDDGSGKPVLFNPRDQDLRDFFTISQNPSDYWGFHDENGNGLIDVGADEFLASAISGNQGTDHSNGPHAADKSYDHPCFVCHDVHETGNPYMIVTENEGVPVPDPLSDRSQQRNNLCLSCHATHGDFAGLTQQELIDGSSNITTVVRAHVKGRAFMDVGFQTRCISCHMPPTGKSAIEGDTAGHVFEPIWPGFVMQPAEFEWTDFELIDGFKIGPMPNSCTSCHAHDPASGSDNIVTQWAMSGHADGYGEPFNHWNGEGEVSSSCARCHSQGGFKQLADSSAGGGLPDFNAVTAQSASYPRVLNCNTCHEENGGGETVFQAGKLQQVVFPSGAVKTLGDSSNICMQCHQGRESGLSVVNASPGGNGYYRFINRHYFAEAAIFFGSEVTAGYEYPGKTYAGKNGFIGHEQVHRQNCIQCHMNTEDPQTGGIKKDHDFFPSVEDCQQCHSNEQGGTLTSFKDLGEPDLIPTGNVDYDGDGKKESFRHEIDGIQARLLVQMNAYAKANGLDPITYTPGGYPYFFQASCYMSDPGCTPEALGSYSTFDKPLLEAAYNYHCAQDPGSGIHNHKYVIQTIYDSFIDMGGAPGYMIRP